MALEKPKMPVSIDGTFLLLAKLTVTVTVTKLTVILLEMPHKTYIKIDII